HAGIGDRGHSRPHRILDALGPGRGARGRSIPAQESLDGARRRGRGGRGGGGSDLPAAAPSEPVPPAGVALMNAFSNSRCWQDFVSAIQASVPACAVSYPMVIEALRKSREWF